MRIIRLQVEGFKRLVAVDITPDGDLVEIRGDNGNGKSSVLDAIFAAFGGAGAAPEMPVREGEEASVIRVEVGDKETELVITRYFTAGGTTGLKVTTPDGAAYSSAQTNILDKLVGHIAFDPLEFLHLKAGEQAEELRKLVDIVDPETGELLDLAAIEEANKRDYATRTDVNRDAKQARARLEALGGVRHVPDDAPDAAAIREQISNAGATNSEIEQRRARRERTLEEVEAAERLAGDIDEDIATLREKITRLETDAAEARAGAAAKRETIANAEPLPALVDTAALAAQLADADRIEENRRVNRQRADLAGEVEALEADSAALTADMNGRTARRAKAIAAAEMPVEGLALVADETGGLHVEFAGVPFSQASDAERLRVSVAVAMRANPKLRVIRLKDASLLDKKSIAILREMATADDFQIWAEFVGDEGPGIIMEAGEVRGADKPEPLDKPRQRKPKAEETETEERPRDGVSHETAAEEVRAGEMVSRTDDGRVKPAAGGTLFERMSEAQVERSGRPSDEGARPRRMREFNTKPKGE